jgi:hypothetical protein
MVLAGATGSALVAHTVVSGGLLVTPTTPIWWGLLTFVAMLAGRRTGWAPRGFARTLLVLALVQAAVHVAMGAAPWLFGLGFHHESAAISPAMLLAHVGALLFSAWLIASAERLIDRAMAVVDLVARVLAERSPRRDARPTAAHLPRWLPPTRTGRAPRSSRAPPALASL